MMRKLATDHMGLEILHLGDCFRLLDSVPIGRIGFTSGGEVLVLPVIFLVDGQDVVFRAKVGSKLASVEVGHYVTFEVDSYDATEETGWSVVVRGLAEVQPETECARLDTLGIEAWGGPTSERAWVKIRPASITGRRMAAAPEED
jgi:nitroimidazol reductase NimA-like FMN-containing flavoprotein (pyridoxamine 5'-phosphate oxidase superfamily)